MITHRIHTLRQRLVTLFACAALFLTAVPLRAQDDDKRDVPSKSSSKFLAAFKDVVVKPSDSVARIACGDKDAVLGTVVGADGWVITKASELKEGKTTCKFKDGRTLDAKVVGIHEPFDLALLKVDAKDLKPVEWADSKVAQVGNWVVVPGLGTEPVAVGVVSVATRSLSKRELSAPRPNPNSGFLGISLQGSDDGPKVSSVSGGSAADKAGVKLNDLLLAIDGTLITDPPSLMSYMAKTSPGQEIKLKIKRGDEELELKAKLGKRPADRSEEQNRMGSELSKRRSGFPTFLQDDAIIKPKDCGGPLVDLDGKTVGINIARAGRVESYAIPSEVVQKLLPELKSGKLSPEAREAEDKHLAELANKLSEARTAYEAAKKAKADLEKKLDDISKGLKEIDKKIADAKKALEKADADLKAAKKEK
jgi:serine protease Do